jgi:hypothetical protein
MQWIGRETISSVAALADAGIVVTFTSQPRINQRQYAIAERACGPSSFNSAHQRGRRLVADDAL